MVTIFDETDRTVAYVYMLDPSDAGAAEEAFRDVYRGNRQITRIVPAQGNYAYSDLLRWFHALDKAMVGEGIFPEYGGVLQLSNHIGFGLADMGQEQDARGLMRELEIPQGAVVFKEGDNQLLGIGTTLKDVLQPIGGLRGGGYRSGYRSYPWRHPTGRRIPDINEPGLDQDTAANKSIVTVIDEFIEQTEIKRRELTPNPR